MTKTAVKHPGVNILKRARDLVRRDRNRERIGKNLKKLLAEIDQALKDKAHIAKCNGCLEAIAKATIILNSQGW